MTGGTVLDVYEEALGHSPSQIVASAKVLKAPDLAAILDARHSAASAREKPTRSSGELWPLVSHHTYGARGIFGAAEGPVLPRTLMLLLLHDGLVIADPLQTVHQTLIATNEEQALVVLNQATAELAEVEGLIAVGALRLTDARPTLQEKNRAATLEALGLSPDLRVFTDLLEAAGSVSEFPGALRRTFAPQVRELYGRFGISISQPGDISAAERRIMDLAAGVIEVSWQFAVAAEDPSCDLAFRGTLEQHLARELVAAGFAGTTGPGRHLETVELGRVPNLDASRLTLADALAARRDDSFESFRSTVRLALDQLETARLAGVDRALAVSTFEEVMQEESRRLVNSARKATFKDRVKEGALPAAVGVVAPFVAIPVGEVATASVAAGISITTVLWQWLLGRQVGRGTEACVRYLSMLGASEPRPTR